FYYLLRIHRTRIISRLQATLSLQFCIYRARIIFTLLPIFHLAIQTKRATTFFFYQVGRAPVYIHNVLLSLLRWRDHLFTWAFSHQLFNPSTSPLSPLLLM